MNYAVIVSSMLFIAISGAWLIVKYHYAIKSRQVKWALFVLFFWILNFIQLIVLAIVYRLTQ